MNKITVEQIRDIITKNIEDTTHRDIALAWVTKNEGKLLRSNMLPPGAHTSTRNNWMDLCFVRPGMDIIRLRLSRQIKFVRVPSPQWFADDNCAYYQYLDVRNQKRLSILNDPRSIDSIVVAINSAISAIEAVGKTPAVMVVPDKHEIYELAGLNAIRMP